MGYRLLVTIILSSVVACVDTGRSADSAGGTAQDPTGACNDTDGGIRYAGNPFVPRFVADPAAHVFNGRVYVYDTDDQSNDDELHYDANGAITQVVQTAQGIACVP